LGTPTAAPGRLSLDSLLEYFDHFAQSRTDAVLRSILIVLDYLLIVLFIPGVIASLLFLIVFIGAFLLLGAVFAWLVKLAQISLTGAIIVYSIVGITIAALLRKHWEAVFEAIAWGIVFLKGVLHLFVPEPAYASAGYPFNKKRLSGNKKQHRTGAGGVMMSRGSNDSEVLPPDDDADLELDSLLDSSIGKRQSFLKATIHKFEAAASAKAYSAQAEKEEAVNRLIQKGLDRFHIKTQVFNRSWKRREDTAGQQLNTMMTEDKLKAYQQRQEQEAGLPKNPDDRYFENVLKPKIKNTPQAAAYKAVSRAQTIFEAGQKEHELIQKVVASDLPEDRKQEIIEQIKKEFRDVLAEDKKRTDIPIHEDED
jgi:hypothetical protein